MAQIQGTIALEGIQKGKKQVYHNDKMPKKRSLTQPDKHNHRQQQEIIPTYHQPNQPKQV